MKNINNEKGFTMIEMMIVLLVISVLLIITIPNITKNQSAINEKGCSAFTKMVQSQVQSYELANNKLPESLDVLVTEKYLNEGETTCPTGEALVLINGIVTAQKDE
ncbi:MULTISPECIES: competence type IV pilus major pilin ComGC [Cytobacillus]|uniref:ComG operon protein 3 n=1 Tax=Cytobacillus stercorigallinarum TaxID=2762240 RepID=A0ABR8QK15_9BACI|nr:competence type IV pilus major pilin ComGC [Cytobacillus stercorigallinarum]MBD7935876.1 prepilin-type N-terminal cleavage/methylation domain-containing protein [Cytobacillus stercorigallinarum]